ncbi:MAG: transcription termination factor Rho [Akkermansiaceae bacterium]
MSNNSTDELFDLPAPEAKPKPEKAAKKATKKKVAKKAAKKVAKKAAKKATVKKKAVKKTASIEKELSKKPIEVQAPSPTIAEAAAKPKPIEAPTLSLPPSETVNTPVSEPKSETPRIGRVPGGGPVQQQNRSNNDSPNQEGQPRISRAKKRRDKRKRRRDKFSDGNDQNTQSRHSDRQNERQNDRQEERSTPELSGPEISVNGIVEMTPKGFGFLRLSESNFAQAKDDIFISPDLIRKHSLRHGQWIHGKHQESNRGPQLTEISEVNGMPPGEAAKLPHFDELKAINPDKRIAFETTPDRYTTRVIDIVSPVGRGQRGLIVSPPRSGKTTLLLHMAEAIREKYDEQIHLMVLLVDERPEEVTEFRRALPGAEIYASSNDEAARNHTRIAELAIERAKRLVEAGKDVFLLMDSITRLARAYNGAMGGGKGRNRATGSGGIRIGALEVPRRLFAAARNTREAGSLTILATALIQTNSRADEAIFMEFKGTGNMELVLDRKIAESYIYPAVDIFKSGTRREELLLAEHTLHKIHLIRRGLSGHRPYEAMERLLFFIKKFPNNPQMLLEIKG